MFHAFGTFERPKTTLSGLGSVCGMQRELSGVAFNPKLGRLPRAECSEGRGGAIHLPQGKITSRRRVRGVANFWVAIGHGQH